MTNGTAPASPLSYWYVKAILAGIAIVLVFFAIGLAFGSRSGTSRTAVCVRAEAFVKSKLVAPASAHFPLCDEMIVQQNGDHEWSVTGYVDAQNAFGASLRHSFSVDLVQDGNNWAARTFTLQ